MIELRYLVKADGSKALQWRSVHMYCYNMDLSHESDWQDVPVCEEEGENGQ